MKNRIFKLDTDAEAAEICCDLYDARIKICASDDRQLKIIYPCAKNVNVAFGENRILISQKKRFSLFSRQYITLYLPSHIVPDVKLCVKHASALFDGGIYGELSLNAEDGRLCLINGSFVSCEVIGGDLDVYLDETTVKGNVFAQFGKGNVLTENSFATRAECRIKSGNLGFVNLNCKECVFEVGKGNITATMTGAEDEYNTLLRAKSGTVNRDGAENTGVQKSIRAFTGKGNIMLDFAGKRADVAEAEAAVADTADGDATNAHEHHEEKQL